MFLYSYSYLYTHIYSYILLIYYTVCVSVYIYQNTHIYTYLYTYRNLIDNAKSNFAVLCKRFNGSALLLKLGSINNHSSSNTYNSHRQSSR